MAYEVEALTMISPQRQHLFLVQHPQPLLNLSSCSRRPIPSPPQHDRQPLELIKLVPPNERHALPVDQRKPVLDDVAWPEFDSDAARGEGEGEQDLCEAGAGAGHVDDAWGEREGDVGEDGDVERGELSGTVKVEGAG